MGWTLCTLQQVGSVSSGNPLHVLGQQRCHNIVCILLPDLSLCCLLPASSTRPPPITRKPGSRPPPAPKPPQCKAIWPYEARDVDELSFDTGDLITITNKGVQAALVGLVCVRACVRTCACVCVCLCVCACVCVYALPLKVVWSSAVHACVSLFSRPKWLVEREVPREGRTVPRELCGGAVNLQLLQVNTGLWTA